MKTVIEELKTKLCKWQSYHKLAKSQGHAADARAFWRHIKELRAAIKKLEAP